MQFFQFILRILLSLAEFTQQGRPRTVKVIPSRHLQRLQTRKLQPWLLKMPRTQSPQEKELEI